MSTSDEVESELARLIKKRVDEALEKAAQIADDQMCFDIAEKIRALKGQPLT